MAVLTDEDIARCEQLSDFVDDEFWMLLAEVKRHRAMVARLNEWATNLEAYTEPGNVGPFIGRELRNRMKGRP